MGGEEDAEDRRLAFRIAFDGRPFHGFQRQPNVRTVEGELLDAMSALGIGAGDGPPVGYAAAGRTDAGVSALAQTVSLVAPSWVSPVALNGKLPPAIRVWGRAAVPDTFHARHDAADRTYVYYLPAARIDLQSARAVCSAVEGTHDFHNLSAADGDTVRTIRNATVEPSGPVLRLTVRAPGFLRQQVRRLASLVAEIGRGERDRSILDRVLSDEPVTGPAGIAPAPPEPLVLADVRYPDVTFRCDHEVRSAVRDRFVGERRHHAAVSRAMGTIAAGLGDGRRGPAGSDEDSQRSR